MMRRLKKLNQRGFTLLEVMIAAVISTLVGFATIQTINYMNKSQKIIGLAAVRDDAMSRIRGEFDKNLKTIVSYSVTNWLENPCDGITYDLWYCINNSGGAFCPSNTVYNGCFLIKSTNNLLAGSNLAPLWLDKSGNKCSNQTPDSAMRFSTCPFKVTNTFYRSDDRMFFKARVEWGADVNPNNIQAKEYERDILISDITGAAASTDCTAGQEMYGVNPDGSPKCRVKTAASVNPTNEVCYTDEDMYGVDSTGKPLCRAKTFPNTTAPLCTLSYPSSHLAPGAAPPGCPAGFTEYANYNQPYFATEGLCCKIYSSPGSDGTRPSGGGGGCPGPACGL